MREKHHRNSTGASPKVQKSKKKIEIVDSDEDEDPVVTQVSSRGKNDVDPRVLEAAKEYMAVISRKEMSKPLCCQVSS